MSDIGEIEVGRSGPEDIDGILALQEENLPGADGIAPDCRLPAGWRGVRGTGL